MLILPCLDKQTKSLIRQLFSFTHVISICRVQLELETLLGKALVEENGYSLLKINNEAYKLF
jgi:hypothetical protein